MTRRTFIDGRCHICKIHSIAKCEGCDLYACESHCKTLKVGSIKLDICSACLKHIKPGIKVAGVKITKNALEE